MFEIEITEVEPGAFAYRVGHHYQPFDPEQPGKVPMSQARAIECASQLKAILDAEAAAAQN